MFYADSNFMRPIFGSLLMRYMFKIAKSMSKGYVTLRENIQSSQYSATENSNKNIFTVNNHFLQTSQHTEVRQVCVQYFSSRIPSQKHK